jgi:hypothetical protein
MKEQAIENIKKAIIVLVNVLHKIDKNEIEVNSKTTPLNILNSTHKKTV